MQANTRSADLQRFVKPAQGKAQIPQKIDDRRAATRHSAQNEIVRHFTPGKIPTNMREAHVEKMNRALDVLGALVGLTLSAPLMLVIIPLIMIGSKGPAFFVQVRVGRGGKLFRMYKLRTMVRDAQKQQASLLSLNEQSGPAFKIKNDPRVTRLGRILRKFSIDEMPQFWNVLKGDMSLVGPRPSLPREVKSYQRWHLQRLTVKPGMTGLWQVSGRNRLDFNDWVRLDIRYIKQRSLLFDVKLMLKTFKVVIIKPDGA
jgi:lipopolysaccharide/colanic/teichoic acid biosynthesis glycosyltransferase